MDRTFVAIDVETTGLEAGVDEIIEVAAVKFRADEVLETFSRLVKPRHSLPLKISRLTGISAESHAERLHAQGTARLLAGIEDVLALLDALRRP